MAVIAVVALMTAAQPAAHAASDYIGQVTTGGVPVPGATVIAAQGETTVRTVTNVDGIYRFAALADGVWAVRVEMVGFEPLAFEITIPPPPDGPPPISELSLLPIEQIVGTLPAPGSTAPSSEAGAGGSAPAAAGQAGAQAGFQRAGVTQVAAAPPPLPEEAPADPTGIGAAAGLLINGSVNNGASTPFAQARGFGTNRPNQRSLYTGAMGLLLGHSAWDARPYSLTGERAAKPDYTDAHALATFQGPFRLWGLLRNPLNVFLGYQRTSDTNSITQSATVPTARERLGDFSQSGIAIVDPLTGQPFAGGVIPANRISPQAAALLGYYPAPNGAGRFNYQAPIVTASRQHSVQSRLSHSPAARHQLFGTLAFQDGTTDATTLFGFEERRANTGLDGQVNWSYRVSPFMSMRTRYQYTRQANESLPHFAHLANVSGLAGIRGNNQDAINWGPPALTFASDVAALRDSVYNSTRTGTHAGSFELQSFRGRHNLTTGGEVRRHGTDIVGQQDPRGSFAFTGAITGSDLADFLLGLPATSSIAYGNADKSFRNASYALYITDDWRVSPSLTLNLGVRWEYESPITERDGRLVNLAIAPGFTAAAPVIAASAGDLPSSLLRPDYQGIQPRLGLAWRPIPGSSVVVRAGYGLYRNTNVYQSIALLLAQQPPLSTTFSVASTPDQPLTLADGFSAVSGSTRNTFAVDPDFRVGFAQNWQASLQRDLPHSLTMVATYLGAKGSRLMQQFLPNTYPAGAASPCADCPSGFRYLTSGGRSIRHAGQIQLRRRLRNGFTATIDYTLAKAMDNAAAFGGASLEGSALAQNWLDLEAEYARSAFDQRHVMSVTVEYTTGAGIVGGTLLDGWKGRLLKDWTLTTHLTAGSGRPLTPVYFSPVRGTGIVGPLRPSLTGVDPDDVPEGAYANAAAYRAPAPGEWGDAPRNSITGPRQFSLNASVARTFRVGTRFNLDWRMEATNLLNQVTYAGVTTLITSPQFGLPNRTNDMRKLRSSLRVRF